MKVDIIFTKKINNNNDKAIQQYYIMGEAGVCNRVEARDMSIYTINNCTNIHYTCSLE